MHLATSILVAASVAALAPAQLVASFTATPLNGPTPLIVTFTDASTTSAAGGITSWAWDFENDGVVDSTAQNPVWVYTMCGSYSVRLTVTDGVNAPVTLVRNAYVHAGLSLGTLTNGNTSFGAGGGNFFDVTVLHPQGILVCALDTKTTAPNGSPITVEVHWTANSYLGVEQTPTAWRLLTTGTATGTGSLQPPVPVTLARPFYLPAGRHGLFVRVLGGGGPQYTSGTNTFANAELSLTLGASQATPFSSAPATPRTWNGVFYYAACGSTGEAGFGPFAAGCAGSLGIPRQDPTTLPQLGQTLTVVVDRLPLSAAILMLGLSNTSSPFGPLPVDLAPFGAPGCSGLVSPDASIVLVGAGNMATWSLPLPNTPGLTSLQFYTQALAFDPSANALGVVASDAAAGILGH